MPVGDAADWRRGRNKNVMSKVGFWNFAKLQNIRASTLAAPVTLQVPGGGEPRT